MNYNRQHRFYCGVDLHARSMYVHVLDHKGKTRFDEHLAAEAACLMIRAVPAVKSWLQRQEKKKGKRKALSVLEAKLGRAVYHLWRKQQAFDLKRFLTG
jgi:hypothetical protein